MTAFDQAQLDLRSAHAASSSPAPPGSLARTSSRTCFGSTRPWSGSTTSRSAKPGNLDEVKNLVSAEQWARFSFVEGDIRDPEACRQVTAGAEVVLHQAAQGSVPRSIEQPSPTTRATSPAT